MLTTLLLLGGMAAIAAMAHQRNRIRMPLTPIAQASEATFVRVHGKVACPTPLRSPYSGRECVYFKVELSSMQFNRRVDREYTERCDFTVVDSTGTAKVHSARAQFEPAAAGGESTRASRLSPKAQALVGARNWRLPEIASVVLRESILAIGDEVDVLGSATREPLDVETLERGFRDAAPTQLVFASDVFVRTR